MHHEAANPDYSSIRAAELEPWLPYLHGNRFAHLVAVKGVMGLAEESGQSPFFGPDGEAFEQALVTLGCGRNAWCGIALELRDKEVLSAGELRLLIETIDPLMLVALDQRAAEQVQMSFGRELLPEIPEPGQKTRLLGRTFVYVNGFESALASEPLDGGEAKHRVWRELKALKS